MCNEHVKVFMSLHPHKLLETRIGHYEEWAIAFTCLCVALGHEARLCVDWISDAWTEVYLTEKYQRWIHLDSRQTLFNAPLTYEKEG